MSAEQQGIRVKRKRGYTMVYNDLLPSDGTLSARAWGIYVYLTGRPDGWETRVSHLQNVFKEGRDAIYVALRELVAAGLMGKETYTDSGLRRTRYVLDVEEATPRTESQATGTPGPGSPDADSQDAGSPAAENPGEVTTDGSRTEGATTERATPPRSARGTRLPEDWWPSEALREWFNAQEFATWINPRLETEQFKDWAKAAPDRTGIKKDWDAAWRGWMRRAAQRVGYGSTGNGQMGNRHTTTDDDHAARVAALDGRTA